MATAARSSKTTTTHAVDIKRKIAAMELELRVTEQRIEHLREVLSFAMAERAISKSAPAHRSQLGF